MNEIIFWSLIVCVPFIAIGMGYGFVTLEEKKEKRRSLKEKFEEQSKLENEFLQSLKDKTLILNPNLSNEQMEQLMIDFNSEPPKIVSPSDIKIINDCWGKNFETVYDVRNYTTLKGVESTSCLEVADYSFRMFDGDDIIEIFKIIRSGKYGITRQTKSLYKGKVKDLCLKQLKH